MIHLKEEFCLVISIEYKIPLYSNSINGSLVMSKFNCLFDFFISKLSPVLVLALILMESMFTPPNIKLL